MCSREGFGDAGDGSAFHREAATGEGSYVWTLPFGLVGDDPEKDVRDLENMTSKKNQQGVGLLNW